MHIHLYTFTHITHANTFTYISCILIHTHPCTCKHIITYTYAHTYSLTHIHIDSLTHIHSHTCIHTHVRTYLFTHTLRCLQMAKPPHGPFFPNLRQTPKKQSRNPINWFIKDTKAADIWHSGANSWLLDTEFPSHHSGLPTAPLQSLRSIGAFCLEQGVTELVEA